MAKLDIYFTADCWSCAETERLVSRVKAAFPSVIVTMITAESGRWPNFVFAAPTYVLNNRIIALGNPEWEHLHDLIQTAIQMKNQYGQLNHAQYPTIQG